MAKKNRHPKAFEDAILNFTVQAGEAQARLTEAMLRLSISDWIEAKKHLLRWVEIGASDAKVFQRVIEEVDYELSRATGERG